MISEMLCLARRNREILLQCFSVKILQNTLLPAIGLTNRTQLKAKETVSMKFHLYKTKGGGMNLSFYITHCPTITPLLITQPQRSLNVTGLLLMTCNNSDIQPFICFLI